jgi:hypothetical protein
MEMGPVVRLRAAVVTLVNGHSACRSHRRAGFLNDLECMQSTSRACSGTTLTNGVGMPQRLQV